MQLMKKLLACFLSVCLVGCSNVEIEIRTPHEGTNVSYETTNQIGTNGVFCLDEVPQYTKDAYVVVNNNIPYFKTEGLQAKGYELYGELDELGRCSEAKACVGIETMPTEKRGSIGSVKPTGWKVAKYDNVDGKYLYNRCHLIGFQLTGENANKNNLVTGTRYLNVTGMLPFENMVADFVKETHEHVEYHVTPIFVGDELVCRGVLMEGYSIEDHGESVCFNVFAYNVQPGIQIDYTNGTSWAVEADFKDGSKKVTYVLNTNTKKFHKPSCPSAEKMNKDNKEIYKGSKKDLLQQGYEPCGSCKP